MKIGNKILTTILSSTLIVALAMPVNAHTISDAKEVTGVRTNNSLIQRIYNEGNVVFMQLHNIVYHVDPEHNYAEKVERNSNASSAGDSFLAKWGINKTNHSVPGKGTGWSFYGWKQNDDSANTVGILPDAKCRGDMQLYAIWTKDCSATVDLDGGKVTNWGTFSSKDNATKGYAYLSGSGKATPLKVQIPSATKEDYTLKDIKRNGVGGYVQLGVYELFDKSAFKYDWQHNAGWFGATDHQRTHWQCYDSNGNLRKGWIAPNSDGNNRNPEYNMHSYYTDANGNMLYGAFQADDGYIYFGQMPNVGTVTGAALTWYGWMCSECGIMWNDKTGLCNHNKDTHKTWYYIISPEQANTWNATGSRPDGKPYKAYTALVNDHITLDGKTYYFGSNGVCTNP